MELPSSLLSKAVEQFQQLPGVGRRTAIRYALHLLKMEQSDALRFGESMNRMVAELRFCQRCHNIADAPLCDVCASPKRDQSTVCVVEDVRDLLAVESTAHFFGTYHLLGGVLSPMDGIGMADLHIDSLLERVGQGTITEVIFALPATTEGDTTCFLLFKKLKPFNVTITSLARGVAVGNELQHTDELTLGRSITSRLPYESLLK